MRRIRRLSAALAAVALLALPAAADAHITVNPTTAPAGAFTELAVRVPNERDNAATVKVDLKLPPGFVFASYEPQPGWSARVITTRLDRPIQTDDGPISQAVSRIVWTGTGKGLGAIPPGAFKDFPISVQIPGRAGDTLTFKALQTYSNGEIVRWIGAPDADEPAPRVSVTAASGEHGAATPATASATSDEGDGDGDGDGASTGLGIAALVLGALGLLAGLVALARSGGRRERERRPSQPTSRQA